MHGSLRLLTTRILWAFTAPLDACKFLKSGCLRAAQQPNNPHASTCQRRTSSRSQSSSSKRNPRCAVRDTKTNHNCDAPSASFPLTCMPPPGCRLPDTLTPVSPLRRCCSAAHSRPHTDGTPPRPTMTTPALSGSHHVPIPPPHTHPGSCRPVLLSRPPASLREGKPTNI